MKSFVEKNPAVAGIGLLVLLALGAGVFWIYRLDTSNSALENQVAGLEQANQELERQLTDTQQENKQLADALAFEQNRNSEFEKQIREIASTVGSLDKLSKTDPELLAKYSKVYFLNENYIPAKLSQIEQEYVYSNKDLYFQSQALPFLQNMLQAARKDGVELFVASAYRSFDTQSGLKSTYSVRYGSGANAFSADQGYSEHQLGTTVDLTSREVGATLSGFEKTSEYRWLEDNAHRFGFILSYPPDNDYYIYEPWHWRFVGVELATHLRNEGLRFYDLGQRELDSYLISIFD
jgi:D-alanyl-D-alanine carboxypeptidase